MKQWKKCIALRETCLSKNPNDAFNVTFRSMPREKLTGNVKTWPCALDVLLVVQKFSDLRTTKYWPDGNVSNFFKESPLIVSYSVVMIDQKFNLGVTLYDLDNIIEVPVQLEASTRWRDEEDDIPTRKVIVKLSQEIK